MRGALPVPQTHLAGTGIIPADAGSTPSLRQAIRQTRDHPRGCGEHSPDATAKPKDRGSSPRMRGALMETRHGGIERRIIPADAGSTKIWNSAKKVVPDHPRGCGEHKAIEKGIPVKPGSSPRMRGALSNCCSMCYGVGIIPADAGSTLYTSAAQSLGHGSSPRMRGAHCASSVRFCLVRIIPADAGSTFPAPICR